MRSRLARRRPSPALVISVIALVVSLGGTAGAAVIITSNNQVAPHTIAGAFPPAGDNANLIAGSVGGPDLRKGSVDSSSLGSSAVTTGKIKDGTIAPADLSSAARGASAWLFWDSGLRSSKNVVAVTNPSAGVFCVRFQPGVPVDGVVATPDFSFDSTTFGTNGSEAFVEIVGNPGDCGSVPDPKVEVATLVRSWSAGTSTAGLVNQGFHLVAG
jgi:hypothetical protein